MSRLVPPPPRSARRAALAVAVVVLLSVIGVTGAAPPVAADPGDIGWEGPSFQGASGSPSGSKPQSKVWFNDGRWWGVLWDTASADFHIWRFDAATRTWVDTGTVVDTRTNSRSDALWTGQHLYIANHVFAESASTGYPALLQRYSYDAVQKRYTPDAGFPATISNVRSETLVIDREPGGRLWATWVQGSRVMVSHTTVDDRTWATPFALPVAGSTVTSDDISSVVAYGKDRVGVFWSNQTDDSMNFAIHLNASAPGTWGAREIAYSGPSAADDHVDVASVSDVGGRVLVAAKTSRSGTGVLTHLLDRDPATGTWRSIPFGLKTDKHTRPIVVVDSQAQRVHVFATSGESGGSIYTKSAPLSNIAFPTGLGTPVLRDASSLDMNNATSTKQTVSAASGLLVLATNDSTRRYWTNVDPLGGTTPPPPPPPPVAPTASFTRTPSTGGAPLAVAFTDTSTGGPTSWAWTFGDGGTSTVRNPSHTYTAPGSYTVSLRATNAAGSHTWTQAASVTVTSTTPPPTGGTTFSASADGYVQDGQPTKAYGTATELKVRAPSPAYESYVRFDVTGLAGAPRAARLRLWVTDASPVGLGVTRVGAAWTETSLTWNARPAALGATVTGPAPTTAGAWVEVDVTGAVTGNGAVALRLTTPSTNSAIVSSREGGHPPQLVVVP